MIVVPIIAEISLPWPCNFHPVDTGKVVLPLVVVAAHDLPAVFGVASVLVIELVGSSRGECAICRQDELSSGSSGWVGDGGESKAEGREDGECLHIAYLDVDRLALVASSFLV